MELFREAQFILVTTPIYAVVILTEMVLSWYHRRNEYSVKGTVTNLYLSAFNMGLDVLMRGFSLFMLNYFFAFRIVNWENTWFYWLALLIAQDFCFYWLHRIDHFCRVFWAVHVTHHSSEEFNLTVGFRSSVFQPLYRFVYFIPLSLVGFKTMDIFLMYSITQIYGILIHTKHVGKLGWLEYFMATPSHHRVHHGSNIKYLDKNMGMVFIFWDKLFGTFQAEEETVVYGLTENIKSHMPTKVIFHEWQGIWADLKKAPTWHARLMYLVGPPGWSHDGSKQTSKQLQQYLQENASIQQPFVQDEFSEKMRIEEEVMAN